ncbi:retrovirus-related pol polyprotein from transposon TNT 1-94 [Tanacetum coccineum]
MNMALVLMAKAFKLNYSTPTNNNQRISSNPRNRQIAQPGMNMGQDRQMRMVEPWRGLGHLARNCTVRPRRRDAAYLQTQLLIAQKEEAGIQLQAEEFDLMAAAADLDEIEEVNANCILMANLQQASTSEEQYTELLEPIPEPHQEQQNDSNVISDFSSVEQEGGTVDQHPATVEETRAYFESLYNNLALEVEKVNSCSSRDSQNLKRRKFSYLINQVDSRLQNFEIQFLKEAAKFVRDFKSLAKEADESLAKHKTLELEIERLLRAVVSQDIMSIVQNPSCRYIKSPNRAFRTKNLTMEMQTQNSNGLQAQLGDLKGKRRITPCVSNTLDPCLLKLEKRMSNRVSGVDNTAKTRRPQPRSNTKNDRVPSASKSSCNKNKEVEVEEHHRNLLLSKNKKHMSSECKHQCLITANHDVCMLNYVNDMNSRGKKQKANVSNTENQKKQKPKVKKPKKVGSNERLASPKPSKPRFCLRWSPTGRFFDIKGKIIASSESESQSDCSNGDNAYDHVAAILGFGDLQWGNILITRVYFVEGLGHNLFSVGQFCDSDLEVAFRRNSCFVRNLDGVDLLKGNRSTNLYTINLHEMASASPICLMARATSTKSCKEKSKRASHPPKPVPNSKQRLHLLYMDLCGPMRIASINGKRYVLVIVDDYSRYTWVHFLRSKDEAPEVIKTFLKRITVLLQSPVIIIRTDNGTEFKNQILKEYFDSVGISHQASSVRTPQQNGVVERRNRTLVEAARTMLIFSRAPLFLWAEAIATACYTQNRSSIHRQVYNRRTKKIMETMNVTFDELSAMAFEQSSSKPGLQSMTSGQISSGLDLTYAPSTITTQKPTEVNLDYCAKAMYDDFIGGQPSSAPRTAPAAQAPQVLQTPTATTTTADTTPTPIIASSQANRSFKYFHRCDELEIQLQVPATNRNNC